MKPFGFLIGVPRKHHLKSNPVVRLRPASGQKYRRVQTPKPRATRQTPVEEE
jgi:hypothetical protein